MNQSREKAGRAFLCMSSLWIVSFTFLDFSIIFSCTVSRGLPEPPLPPLVTSVANPTRRDTWAVVRRQRGQDD